MLSYGLECLSMLSMLFNTGAMLVNECEGEGRRRGAEGGGTQGKGKEGGFCLIYSIYLHIPSYTFTIYFKMINIRKVRVNVKHKTCHKSGFRACPRVRISHKGSYHVPRRSSTPNGAQF